MQEVVLALNRSITEGSGEMKPNRWLEIIKELPEDVLLHFKHFEPTAYPGFALMTAQINRPWKMTSSLQGREVQRMINGDGDPGNCVMIRGWFESSMLMGRGGFMLRVVKLYGAGYPIEIHSDIPFNVPSAFSKQIVGAASVLPDIKVVEFKASRLDTRLMKKGSVPNVCDGALTLIAPDGRIYPCYLASIGGLRGTGVYARGYAQKDGFIVESQSKCFLRCPYGYSKTKIG